jgi:hypothetical protein
MFKEYVGHYNNLLQFVEQFCEHAKSCKYNVYSNGSNYTLNIVGLSNKISIKCTNNILEIHYWKDTFSDPIYFEINFTKENGKYIQLMENSWPYGWYIWFTDINQLIAMVPLESVQYIDQNPYVFYNNGIGKCYHPVNNNTISLNITSIGGIFPGNKTDDLDDIISIPSIWISQNIFKGMSHWMQWTNYANIAIINNRKNVIINGALLPWDSGTEFE